MRRTSWGSSETVRAILLVTGAIVVANLAFTIVGNVSSPLWWTANVSSHLCNWYCGIPTFDPNVGFITQPLGHLSALDLLHGHVPWWNYYEGMGQPLAGEMQSAALFPLVLLFLLPSGLLFFHLALQFIAGITTYLLARRLGVGFTIATLSGVLFALNGTFAWVGNAAINPICFLPMLILGIEISLGRSRTAAQRGLTVTALAVALSIYAGFPEMAYLDGLLAAGWAITRTFELERPRRIATLVRVGAGGALGVALSLPVLVSFVDFARVANLGDHATNVFASITTAPSTLTLLVNPYAGGALFGGSSSTPYNLIGYFTASVAVFAIAGLWGRRMRPLRCFLAAWLAAAVAVAVNILGVRRLWDLLPGMDHVDFARYIWPSAELAVIVLAALGLSDILEHGAHRRRARWASLVVAVLSLSSMLLLSPFNGHEKGSLKVVLVLLIALPLVAVATLGYSLYTLSGRAFVTVVTTVMVVESLAFFAVPALRTPTSITVANGSINYLQSHEGLNRFLSLGVLTPNWGSQYSLNEINAIDLPLPASFSHYISTSLAPANQNPRIFIEPFTTTVQDDVAAHLANYEAVGVAYVLTPPKALDPKLSALGLTLVAQDALSRLYRLPQAAHFYATALSTCVISSATIDHVDVTCPAATTLTRLELSMAGWSAHVNGVRVAITSPNALTQSVAIPAGSSSISFDYLPPHEDLAVLGALVALVAIAATWLPRRRRRTRRAR